MPERWERELDRWGSVKAPERMRVRMEEGPHGEGMPPTPARGQRVAAALVAFAVFGAALALVLGAFGHEPAPPLTPGPNDVVVTLHGDDTGATGSMTIDGRTIPARGSCTWSAGNLACAAPTPTWDASEIVTVEAGRPILVVGNAESVTGLVLSYPLRVGGGSMASFPVRDGRAQVPSSVGRYVLDFRAAWPQGRGGFMFAVDIVPPRPTSSPTISATVVPDVTGMSELDAYRELRTNGFIPLVSEYPWLTPGVVDSTTPAPGTRVRPNTTVNMDVGGTMQDNDYSGNSWLDPIVAADPQAYLGAYVDPGGIDTIAVFGDQRVGLLTRGIDAVAAGRPFEMTVCADLTRATVTRIVDRIMPMFEPAPKAGIGLMLDPASCRIVLDSRSVSASQAQHLAAAFPGVVGVEDLTGVGDAPPSG